MEFSRVWAMPNSNTFEIKPIHAFVLKYYGQSHISADPFARNFELATYTNDLNPETKAQSHMDATAWLRQFPQKGTVDLLILDPPYSVRQVSECYKQVGLNVTAEDTRSDFWTKMRDAAMSILTDDAVVLSFGWNTVGMGIKRGFEIVEIMLVCHGGVHNDTICLAERRLK